ncbi:unnamed protein product [Sphagnum jensenii]|uniref:Histidine kinase domain-containing protein n=1 Tax=Sphagnum jensenii TaxID=128206 RepID=A0ABP0VYE7_9BRYO
MESCNCVEPQWPQMIYSCDTSTSPTSSSRSRISRFRWSSFTSSRSRRFSLTDGVPLLHLTNFHHADWPDSNKQPFTLMVLMLPSNSARRWHVYELELVEVVADQNVQLDMARREAETAICARNNFLAVMNHKMRTPMHAIIALSSLLQETELMLDQCSMVDTILKSSNLLATLINDILDLSHLEDGSLELEMKTFKLLQIFIDVRNLVKPIASLKKLQVLLSLAPDLPGFVVGDDKRLMQMALNVVGNAVKFTKEGSISIKVSLERAGYLMHPLMPEFYPVQGEQHCYIRVEVQDTGVGLNPKKSPWLDIIMMPTEKSIKLPRPKHG